MTTLTKREEFVKAAMQAMLAADIEGSFSSGTCAVAAVKFADACIAAMERTEPEEKAE